MNSEDGVTHVTPADGNVFADLGFDEQEARDLQARSRAIIEEKLAIKISLMEELHAWKKREKLKQGKRLSFWAFRGLVCRTSCARRHRTLPLMPWRT